MAARIGSLASVFVFVLALDATWCKPQTAQAKELDGLGILHLGEDNVAGSLRNLATAGRVRTFPGTSGLGGTLSPDGEQVALFDVDAGRLVNRFEGDSVKGFMQEGVSDDGKLLVIANRDRSDGH